MGELGRYKVLIYKFMSVQAQVLFFIQVNLLRGERVVGVEPLESVSV